MFDQVSTEFKLGGGHLKELERATGPKELFSAVEETPEVAEVGDGVQLDEDGFVSVPFTEHIDLFGFNRSAASKKQCFVSVILNDGSYLLLGQNVRNLPRIFGDGIYVVAEPLRIGLVIAQYAYLVACLFQSGHHIPEQLSPIRILHLRFPATYQQWSSVGGKNHPRSHDRVREAICTGNETSDLSPTPTAAKTKHEGASRPRAAASPTSLTSSAALRRPCHGLHSCHY